MDGIASSEGLREGRRLLLGLGMLMERLFLFFLFDDTDLLRPLEEAAAALR